LDRTAKVSRQTDCRSAGSVAASAIRWNRLIEFDENLHAWTIASAQGSASTAAPDKNTRDGLLRAGVTNLRCCRYAGVLPDVSKLFGVALPRSEARVPGMV